MDFSPYEEFVPQKGENFCSQVDRAWKELSKKSSGSVYAVFHRGVRAFVDQHSDPQVYKDLYDLFDLIRVRDEFGLIEVFTSRECFVNLDGHAGDLLPAVILKNAFNLSREVRDRGLASGVTLTVRGLQLHINGDSDFEVILGVLDPPKLF